MKTIAPMFLVLALSASGAAAQTAASQTAGPEPHIDTVAVESVKGPPIIQFLTYRVDAPGPLGQIRNLVVDFHFIAPQGNAISERDMPLEMSERALWKDWNLPITNSVDSQKSGTYFPGAFATCPEGSIYHATAELYIVDANGNHSNTVRFTMYCNGASPPKVTQQVQISPTKYVDVAIPHTGTEAALRSYIEGWEKGEPPYEIMSSSVAAEQRTHFTAIKKLMDSWGIPKSITFKAVDKRGLDTYLVEFEHGESIWSIPQLTADGKLGGLFFGSSETQAEVGSNFGLTDYPAATCVQPFNIDGLKPGSVPPLDAKRPEIDAYDQRVTRYNDALNNYNSQMAEYNSCIQIYAENGDADIRRVQSVFDAAVASAQSANLETVTITGPGTIDSSANTPFFDDQHIDTVTVEESKIPPDKAIAGFVKSYAAPSIKADKIPKWASGICPTTLGLTAELNLGVTALLKLVAAQVGAPVATKVPCDMNVEIVFTRTPQAVLDDIAKNYEDLLGYHDVAQTKHIATMTHPIQAWYTTSTQSWDGQRVLDTLDDIFESGGTWMVTLGGHLQSGYSSELSYVTIVVDVSKLGGLGIKPVANYVAMLALSQTKTFETCQPLASITNLMTPGCDAAFKLQTFSSNDIAYLSALYKTNPYNVLQVQQSNIAHQMETALSGK